MPSRRVSLAVTLNLRSHSIDQIVLNRLEDLGDALPSSLACLQIPGGIQHEPRTGLRRMEVYRGISETWPVSYRVKRVTNLGPGRGNVT